MKNSNLPLIAIIGRVNVGKSTLFNKLLEQHKALVSKIPGTTRDLNFGICEWQGKKIQIVDTGGIFETKIKKSKKYKNIKAQQEFEESIDFQIEKKAREILEKANLLLFLVDTKDGIMNDDRLIAQLIKKNKKPFIFIANKCDSQVLLNKIDEFKKLGLGDAVPVSATTGKGVGDLLDKITEFLPPLGELKREEDLSKDSMKISIIGKPNVGKSSLLNKIIGEERVIVSATPHTTREPQDTELEYKNHYITLIDTAGIRRKNLIRKASLEKSGIEMSIKALKKSDLALFVLDVSENLTAQDAQLAGLIIKSGVSLIFVANKYDLIAEKEMNTTQQLTKSIYQYFPFLTWAPIIFTSAKSGKNCHKILNLILEIHKARTKKINKEKLNELIKNLFKKMPPPRQQRKPGAQKKSRAFISKAIQKDTSPPVFEISVTNIVKIPESYLNYLKNNIRQKFGFSGTPIKIVVSRMKK